MVNHGESPMFPKQSTAAPATTPEHRENQLVSAAYDLAEQQIRSGKASSQVIVHFLKLGSSRERLEQKRLEMETSVMVTKQELMQAQMRGEDLMVEALKAMAQYTGNAPAEQLDDEDA